LYKTVILNMVQVDHRWSMGEKGNEPLGLKEIHVKVVGHCMHGQV